MLKPCQRRKYDSFIVWLYASGKERYLPEEFRSGLPFSTVSTWRNINYAEYHGHEFRHIQEKGMEWFELYSKHKRLEKVTRTIAKVWVSLSGILMPVLNKAKEYEVVLLDEAQRLFSALPKRMALRIMGISAPAFHHRIAKLKQACSASPLSLCMKRHPLQLCLLEVGKIKELLSDTATECWPSASVYYKALRGGMLSISLSTFYKYVGILGLKRKFTKPLQKRIGIQSSKPNEYLHVDTTYVTLADNVKAAVVFVSDNFSRNILGWCIGKRNSAENVKNALSMALGNIKKYHPTQICATLVADGGMENHAVTVADYLASESPPEITKVIALKDISFSNSPAEAVNKVMKRYIRKRGPQTLGHLKVVIGEAVYDYSFVRPHGSLKGLTPMETYTDCIPDMDFSSRFVFAKAERMEQNRKTECGKC